MSFLIKIILNLFKQKHEAMRIHGFTGIERAFEVVTDNGLEIEITYIDYSVRQSHDENQVTINDYDSFYYYEDERISYRFSDDEKSELEYEMGYLVEFDNEDFMDENGSCY